MTVPQLDAIAGLTGLGDDPDVVPVSAAVLEHARAAHARTDASFQPDISPNENGTVSFEWETGRGRAHLQIGRTRFSMYVAVTGEPTFYLTGQAAEAVVAVTQADRIRP